MPSESTSVIANPMKALRRRLAAVGVKRGFLDDLVLPSWWEDSIAETQGGFREAASYISARLGFSLASLVAGDTPLARPRSAGVKHKKANGKSAEDVSLVTHFAISVARVAAGALRDAAEARPVPPPEEWRNALLKISDQRWLGLRQILTASWGMGIPVIHVRNLPVGVKKPDAMTTMIGNRPVIAVMNLRKSPSWIAFIVAHELGHIHHRHIEAGQTLVDEKMDRTSDEKDEADANDFAVRLLTGFPNLGLSSTRSMDIPQLSAAARTFGNAYRIAPGVAALNYGFTTGQWPLAIGALTLLEKADDASQDLRKAMEEHVDLEALPSDSREWLCRATREPR